MQTNSGQLTYCTNIHFGEKWNDHFNEIKKYFPGIKKELSPDKPMGIGLRLSNVASLEIIEGGNLDAFRQWLSENGAYVFTMNGFPYGSFHDTRVKDQVHAPDWTTNDRVNYTIRLFHILKDLLPAGAEGGISTSPLTYRHWFDGEDAFKKAMQAGTANMVAVAETLIEIHQATGKMLHLDIEPEPDGMLETGKEFLHWFTHELLPTGGKIIAAKSNVSITEAEALLKEHIRLCYDVCHFAIGYEPHAEIIREIQEAGIKIGKIQVSAALKGALEKDPALRGELKESFSKYNEPTYLHQVVAKKYTGELLRYPDLTEALAEIGNAGVQEWRAHFHVPIFEENFGALQSTQKDIVEVLHLQKQHPFTSHLEVETYTWDVLPGALKLPIQDSIVRELQWVLPQL